PPLPPPDAASRPEFDPAEVEALGVKPPVDVPFTEEDLAAQAKAEPVPIEPMSEADLWGKAGVQVDPTSAVDRASTEEDKEARVVLPEEIGHGERTRAVCAMDPASAEPAGPLDPEQAAKEAEIAAKEAAARDDVTTAEDPEIAAREAEIAAKEAEVRDAEIAAREAEQVARVEVAPEPDPKLDAPDAALADPGSADAGDTDLREADDTGARYADRRWTDDPSADVADALRVDADSSAYELSEADAAALGAGSLSIMTCLPFNMTDAIRAGILGRSLWVAWRAQLVPNQVFINTTDIFGYENTAASRFWSGHLGRDPSCLGCHTSSYSTTDARPRNGSWDRFFPPAGTSWQQVDVEGSALTVVDGSTATYGGLGGTIDPIRRLFRRDALRPAAGSQGQRPWGMSTVCTNSTQWKGFEPTITAAHPYGGNAGIGDLPATSTRGPLDLMNEFPSFVNGFSYTSSPLASVTVAGSGGLSGAGTWGTCLGCHDPYVASGNRPALNTVVPPMSDEKLFRVVRYGSMGMPAIATSDSQAWAVIAYMRNVKGLTGAGNVRYVDAEDGIANLLAQRIVNKVVEDIQGYPLTIGHGFPRNADAAALMNELTRVFVGSGWSLQALLRYIVLTNAFNRNAPAETWSSGGTPLSYELPMMAQPWAGEPPGGSYPHDRNANGQGDLVHRETIPALYHHVHEALGWPDAAIIDNGRWPYNYLQMALGRPSAQESTTGRAAIDLEALARWEGDAARCQKPYTVRAADVLVAPGVTVPSSGLLSPGQWRDWIDVLRLGSGSWTARDQIRSLKTRLIADPDLTTTEEALFAQLLGVTDLSVAATSVTDAGLRRACGVLLMTPDYLMRRLPVQPTTTSPTLEVCLEPSCTKADYCSLYTSRIRTLGYGRDCNGAWVLIGTTTGTATGST
ncbi:MAG TPA: cytochrome c, partial [Myxococcota bacterium]|nr:cytochrome c [Myxococcota bacterium]